MGRASRNKAARKSRETGARAPLVQGEGPGKRLVGTPVVEERHAGIGRDAIESAILKRPDRGSERVTIRLRSQVMRAAKEQAEADGVPVAALLRTLIERGLGREVGRLRRE